MGRRSTAATGAVSAATKRRCVRQATAEGESAAGGQHLWCAHDATFSLKRPPLGHGGDPPMHAVIPLESILEAALPGLPIQCRTAIRMLVACAGQVRDAEDFATSLGLRSRFAL